MPSNSLRCFSFAAVTVFVAGCGGGSQVVAPFTTPTATPSPATTLGTASNDTCITPQTQAQTVSLPATGGISGSITFGAFASGATGCDELVVTTGADAANQTSRGRAFDVRRETATTTPEPILTISVGQAFGSVPIFGFTQIVTGLQVMGTPQNLPDGTYYATITDTGVLGTITSRPIPIVAQNGVLTVGQNGFNAYVNGAYSSATFKLYALGVTPPEPSSSPSASPSPSPSATAIVTPTPAPSNSPSPAPTTSGNYTIFQEGQFVPACFSDGQCPYATIDSLIITAMPGQFYVDVKATYNGGGKNETQALYSDQGLHQDEINGYGLTIQRTPFGYPLTEALESSCDSTDDEQCGNSPGGFTDVTLFFASQDDENTFNTKFTTYRNNTGSYDF
jgi:hypothetical protein